MTLCLLGLSFLFAINIKEPIWVIYLAIFVVLILWKIVIVANPIRNCINEILYIAFQSTFGFAGYMTVYCEYVYRKMGLTSLFLLIIPFGLFGLLLAFLVLYRRNYYLGVKKVAFNKKPIYGIAVIGTLAFGTLIRMLFSSLESNTKLAIVALVMLLLAFTFGINIESFYRYIWARKYKEYFLSDAKKKQ